MWLILTVSICIFYIAVEAYLVSLAGTNPVINPMA